MSNNSFASNLKRGSMDQGRLTSSNSTTPDAPISNKRAFPGAGSPRSSPNTANQLQLPNFNKPCTFSYSDSHVFNGPPTKRHCVDDMECEDKENNPTTTASSSTGTASVASVKQKRRESLGRNTNGNATPNNTNTSAIASYTTSPESAKLTSMMGGLSLGLGNLNFNKFSMDAINAPTVTVVSMQEDGTERKVSPRELLFSTLEKPKLKLPYHQDAARPEFNSITAATAANLLRGPFKQLYEKVIVVDCRYGYEYLGGHIGGALNYPEGKDIEVLFDTERKLASNHDDICFVFHCEFSSHRGPFGYKRFSELDKKFNGKDSRKTTFKEIYLLEKGYKAFFTEYKTLCDPQKYIQMDDPLFKDELQRIKAEKKNITETTKSRISSGFASKSSVNLFANYKESPMPKSPMSMTSGSIFSPERSPLSRSMSSAMAGRNEQGKSYLTSSVGNMGGNNFLFGKGAQQDRNGLFAGATNQHHQPASLPPQGNLFGPAFNNAQFTQQSMGGTSPGSIFDDLDEVEENSPNPNANGLPFLSGNASFSDLPFDALSLNDDHPPPPANLHHTNSNGKNQHSKSSHSSGDRTHTLSRKPSHRDRSERKGGSAENGGEGKSRKPSRARPTSLVYKDSSSFASSSNHLNQYSNVTASPSAMNVIDDVISPFKGATHTPPSNLSHSASGSSQSQLHLSQPLPRTSHSAPTSSRELFPRSNSSCSLTITNDNVAEDNVTKVKNYNFAIHNVSGNYSNQPLQMQPPQGVANVSSSGPVYPTRPVSALRDSKSDSEFRLQTRPLSKSISIPRHSSSPVISMDEDFSRPDTPFRPFESKETRSERESNASQQHSAKVMQQHQQQMRPHSHSFSQSTGHGPLQRTNSCGGAEVMAMMNHHASANMNSGSSTLNSSNGANLSGSTSSQPGSGSSSLASSTGSIFSQHKSFATNPTITNRKKELIFDDKSGQDSAMLRVRAGSMGDLWGARQLSSSSSSSSSMPGKENLANGRTLANSNQFGSGRREKTRAAISDRNGRPTETNWANKVFNSQRSSPTQIRAQSSEVTISQNSPTAYALPNNLTTNQNSPTGGFQLNQSNSWSG